MGADDDEVCILALGDEGILGRALDESLVDVCGRPEGKLHGDIESVLRRSVLRVELTGKIAGRHCEHPRLGERGGRNERPGEHGHESGFAEARFLRGPAECLDRGLRPIDADDDRSGHSVSLQRRL